MKRMGLTAAAALLSALLLFGCGQAAQQVGELPAEGEGLEQEDLYPFQDFPAEAYPPQPTTAPTRVDTDLFQAKFEGDAVSGSGGAVGGKFHFIATQTDGEAWHVKLEANYPTVAGRDYFVTYRFHSDVAGTVKFGDFQEFQIQAGDNEVTGVFTAKEGTSYLDLQLGMLPAFTIDFTEIEVKEYADEVTYENALPKPINFERESLVYERHDQGYDTVLARADHAINVNYESIPTDLGVWKSRVYVRTGMVPEPGTHYRVTADVMLDRYDRNIPFEVLFNDGDVEKGYGALYGQELVPGEVNTIEAVITGNGNGDELILQFSLGEARAGSLVIVGNVHVDKVIDRYNSVLPADYRLDGRVATGNIVEETIPISYKDIPLAASFYSGVDTVYERHDDGYIVKLTESASSATMAITRAPKKADDRGVWKAKLYAATGVTLQPGTSYLVQFDLDSTGNQADYEVCFDGNNENDYGALYGRSLRAGGTDHVEMLLTPDESHGPLTIRLQLGKTDTASGNTVTLRNLSVKTVKVNYTSVLKGFSYNTTRNVWEDHGDGVEQTVEADGSSATLAITQGRDGGGVWSSKLFIATGVTPEAGKRYRVITTVTSDKAMDGENKFEVLYKNGGENYEGSYGLTAAAGEPLTITQDFTAPDSGCNELVLLYQLGNSPADNTITVSDIKVVPVTSTGTSILPEGFAYPVTTGSSTVHAGYAEQPLSLSASAVAYDGSAATASSSGTTATLEITQPRGGSGGGWSIRLHANTGVTLERGVQYRVSGTLKSSQELSDVEVLYSNGSDEDGSFNPGGKGYMDGTYGLSVNAEGTHFEETFTVLDRTEYRPLVLRVQVGNSPAPNTVTLSDIKVEKWVPEHEEAGTTTDNSFKVETNADSVAANLTGDGNSATATVTTPGDDWHVKFYAFTGATLEAGKTYQISFDVIGAAGCTIAYKNPNATEGDPEEAFGKEENVSDGPVTHTVTPTVGGPLEIVLKIGNVPANTAVKVSNVDVKVVTETEGDNLMTDELVAFAPINAFVHEDYAATLSNTSSSATINITKAPATGREPWKVKLFAETGAQLKAGKTYRVSVDVQASRPLTYDLCYNNQEKEAGFGAQYGQEASKAKRTVTYTVTPDQDGVLFLQFGLGNATGGTTFTISGIKVEEVSYSSAKNVTPKFRYDSVGYISKAADDGYVTSLEQSRSAATFRIHHAPAAADRHAWSAKLNVRTGITPKAGMGYRVTVTVDAAKAQDLFEIFYDGNEELAYGALYEQRLSPGSNTFTYTIMPGDSKGELNLQLRFGQTNASSGNTYTVTGFKVEEVTFVTTRGPEIKDVVENVPQDGYTTQLTKTADRATLQLVSTPGEEALEAWKNKLFVYTGVTFEPGQKYRVSFTVKSIIPAPFEVCFNDGDVEKGLGAIFGLTSLPYGEYVEYTTYADKTAPLVIQVSLGNCLAPNTIFLTDVKVEKAGKVNLVTDTIYTF